MIGKNKPRFASNTTLKDSIAIGLDETFTAIEESFHDLTDEEMRAFPIPGRTNVAWILMHVLENLDHYANLCQAGKKVFFKEPTWRYTRMEIHLPKPDDEFLAKEELLEGLKSIREAAMDGIERATEEELTGQRCPKRRWKKTSADAYMRTIEHAMCHVRQIWLLRGALGRTDSWPRQHWA
jgi:hypothetical protein